MLGRGGIVAVMELFQHPHDPIAVVGLYVAGGKLLHQQGVKLRRGQLFQLPAVAKIGHFAGKLIPVRHRADVQSRAAHQKGDFSPGQNIVDGLIGQPLKVRHGEKLARLHHVDQVMRHAPHFLRGDLAAAQIHAPVDLPGIGGDDLAAEALGHLHAQCALA